MMTTGDDTTTGGDKPKKKKKSAVPPRPAELAYLHDLGMNLDDAESKRSPSTLNLPPWSGPNLASAYGRECAREKRHFLRWLRGLGGRSDSVGRLARALERHEASLAEGQAPPTHWVQLASRIGRGEIHDELGRAALREALEVAREQFRTVALSEERVAARALAAAG